MKVRELIKWLEIQDQGAVVEVLVEHASSGFYGEDYTTQEPFIIDEHSDYCDLRENPYVKEGDPRKNTRTLLLGGTLI